MPRPSRPRHQVWYRSYGRRDQRAVVCAAGHQELRPEVSQMLVTFRSKAAGSITMFGEHATPLLKMMGASGQVPGAFNSVDVPGALRSLQAGLQGLQTPAPAALNEDSAVEDEEDRTPVSLAVRAKPLLELLQRAAAAGNEVLWEKTA